MRITYLGHSCVHIHTGKHQIIIDPFLTGNPVAASQEDQIEADYVLLTHGHLDHIADAESIARRTGATIIAIVELAGYFEAKGLRAIGMNLGGQAAYPFGSIKFTPALHTSSVTIDGINVYLGVAAGFILNIDDFMIYHSGDTALFSDMKLIGARSNIDLAFLPIGDFFTMGPEEALIAAEWIQAKHVVPVHYNTFDVISQDGDKFVSDLQKLGIAGTALKPGESLDSDELNL
ncbi:metal-dependent hydrolase [compost metagenome]